MYTPYWATRPEPGIVPDGPFAETITTYERDGAAEFLQEPRDAVTACPTEQRGVSHRIRLLSGTARGDESARVERPGYETRDVSGNPTGRDDVRLVSVVRTGALVMVLYETSWEHGWSADPSVVDAFTCKAFSGLRSWLG